VSVAADAPIPADSAEAVADPPISVDRLTVRYPGRKTPSLEAIEFAVAAGERVGVAGRTGAGKSTLGLAVSGFIPRVVRARLEGRAVVDGIDATTAASGALLGRVGIVFATPANQLSASKLTVREELAFGLENLGVPRDEMDGRIDRTLDQLGIAHLSEREPFALSGGEQQRVAIASIVAMGTNVLVLDEPTAQLDPAGTTAVADLLGGLARSGTAVLCIEHDPSVLGGMDRCLVLDTGRAIALDLPGIALAEAGDLAHLLPPTLVRLAAAGTIDLARAFDEAAVAEGLRPGGADPAAADRSTTTRAWSTGSAASAAGSPVWVPGRERPPVTVTIEDLVHRYPTGVEAVRGVSLTIAPGEAVAILGQNGSGKTTLVKHLNGLLRPNGGDVLIDGVSTGDRTIADLARTVGFVFQNPDDQLFERSVSREVSFGPRNLGLPSADVSRLVAGSLAAVGLDAEAATNPYDLDLSRRKLVALAGILAMDPAVLVLDEPTTGQDADGVERVGAIVSAFQAAGRSIVAITHDMEFAAANFARIVVMRAGEIVADGPPAEIFAATNRTLLASTGLTPPPTARISALLGLDPPVLDPEGLVAAFLAGRTRA
jgi:energy-coupling factor transport system ATP-binding protein